MYRKNLITIRTLLQYTPQILMENLWENVRLAVQPAPGLCHSILSSNRIALTITDQHKHRNGPMSLCIYWFWTNGCRLVGQLHC